MNPDSTGRASAGRLSRRHFLALGGSVGAVVAAPGLVGCSRAPEASGGGSKGDGTFTLYWNPGHVYKTYEDVIAKFEKDHDVTVNWQKLNWPDMIPKLQADISSGNVPDLVEQPGAQTVIPYAISGDALPLDSYIDKDGADMGFPSDWQPETVKPWQHDGRTYGVQLQLTCNQLYYNKGMLEQAGISEPPGTWDDFLAAAKELTRDGVHGVALNPDSSYSWSWFLQNEVSYYDEASGNVLHPNDAAIEAMRFQHDLVHKHKVAPVPPPTPDYTFPQKLFSAKKAAMILTGPWDIAPIREGSPDIDLGLALPLEGAVRATYIAGAGLFIPRKAKNPDLAWDLIKRLTTLDVELALTQEAEQTMPRKSWANNETVQSTPIVGDVAAALEYAKDFPGTLARTGKFTEVNEAFMTYYESVLQQGASPAAEFEGFVQQANRALA